MSSKYPNSPKSFPKHRNVRKREVTISNIRNTRRVERTIKLIRYLSHWHSIKDIADHLDIHYKSVFRYINLLTQLGFEVEVSHGKYHEYRIINIEAYFKNEVTE